MKSSRHTYYLLLDIIIVAFSFLFVVAIKPATLRYYLPNYYLPFLGFLVVWVIVSILNKKYLIIDTGRLRTHFWIILRSNFLVLALLIIVLYFFHLLNVSRFIILGTVIISTFLEMFFISLYVTLVIKTKTYYDPSDETSFQQETTVKADEKPAIIHDSPSDDPINKELLTKIKQLIIDDSGEEVYNFLHDISGFCNEKCSILSTNVVLNILLLPNKDYSSIINLKRINSIRRINKFFEAINMKLVADGLFICCVETYLLRKQRILNKMPFILNYIYYFFDFIYTRVFPKLPVTKQIYFAITKGKKRVLSKAETFGRLYSCGFEIIAEREIQGYLYVASTKSKEPAYDRHPTYGLFIKLTRYGKNGKIIKLYKLRTMHAYAEYLQDYIYEQHYLEEGGKFKDDFRRSTWGKFLRKFWIDELPSLINLIKGDIKLVGVRPLSPHYFNLYNEKVKQRRLKYKPGLIPPYYANLPKTLDEIMASELKYLQEYEKHPIKTDIQYFFKSIYNIIIKRARSS